MSPDPVRPAASISEPSCSAPADAEALATGREPRAPGQRDGSVPRAVPKRHQSLDDNAAVLSERAAVTSRELLCLPGGDVEVFSAGDGPPLILMHPMNIGAGAVKMVRQ